MATSADERNKKRERDRKWYLKNRDRILILRKKYRNENKEKVNELSRLWHDNNKERVKKYKNKNKEKITQQKKEWRRKNYRKIKENIKIYRENNKERISKLNEIRSKIYRKSNIEKIKIRGYAYRNLKSILMDKYHGCERCGGILNLEMHHKKYTNKLEDVELLCRECHVKAHLK